MRRRKNRRRQRLGESRLLASDIRRYGHPVSGRIAQRRQNVRGLIERSARD